MNKKEFFNTLILVMDPLSQGVLGAIYSQAVVKHKKHIVPATIIGFLSGILPDIDTFIRIPGDPLSYLEYHRHFTHSLAFIPIGALIAAILFYKIFRKNLSFKQIYIFSFLGYATHGLLDACTSYGTQLLQPFSNYRVAWDIISIIDPLFTIPILLLMIYSVVRKNKTITRAAIVYSLLYLSLGFYQNKRAYEFVKEVASARGHSPKNISVKPTFGNLIVWKLIYLHDEKYYVDAAYIFINKKLYPGESAPKLNLDRDFSWLATTDVQYNDVSRFSWFSSGYLAVHPDYPDVIGDMRYSLLPNEVRPIWGIRLNQKFKDQHVPYESFRGEIKNQLQILWMMIKGEGI